MNQIEFPERRQEPPHRNFFWPLALILVGAVLLLNNLGLLGVTSQLDLWDLWPVLFILIGLDSMLNRSGFVGATLFIGLGAVLLLNNLGYLQLGTWPALLSLWPVLVIAAGLDLIFGRRHWLFSVFGAFVILVILYFSIGALVSGNSEPRSRLVTYDLQNAQTVQAVLDLPLGALRVRSGAPAGSISAQLPTQTSFETLDDFQTDGNQAWLSWRTAGMQPMFNPSGYPWQLDLPAGTQISLSADMGAGDMNLDVTGLDVGDIDVETGLGSITLTLPQGDDLQAKLDAGIGRILIHAPEGVGVRVRIDRALTVVQVPSGYTRDGDVYTSPGYEQAQNHIDLEISAAIGIITVR